MTKSGVGEIAGEYASYAVSIEKQLEDNRIWRIITNGYPYKDLGLNESDAFTATKHAIYTVLADRDVRSYYRANVKDEALRERGEQVLQAMEQLVDIGKNGTDTRIQGKLSIVKQGEFQTENETYYSQEFSIHSNVVMKQYELAGMNGFPEGSKIVDLSNQEKTNFQAGENFKLLIPIQEVKADIQGEIYIQGEGRTYPIFYGESPDEQLQNYAVCYDVYGSVLGSTRFTKEIKGKVSVRKVAKENNIWTGHRLKDGVAGAIYELKDKEGKSIATFTSDKEGSLMKDYELPIGEYTLTEIHSPNYFEKDKKEHTFSVTTNEQEIEIELLEEVKKGGYVTIQKTSEDKNFWNGKKQGDLLSGAVYQIRNQQQEILYELTTNENGSIEEPLKLEEGDYTIQEISAPEFYILDDTIYEFKIEKNEQLVELQFKDKSKPTPKLPRTGF